MYLKFIIPILIFVFISCGENKTSENFAENIKINFKTNNLSYGDVFKETLAIPLETNKNCLISEISQMKIFEDKIFILDWKLNSLLVFNMKGKFLNKIGTVGRGPGEYIRPRYFYISKNDSLVKVFDAPMKKLICFDVYGKHIKDIILDKYLDGVGETSSGYWGYCGGSGNKGVDLKQQKNLKFFIFDSEGHVENYIKGIENIDNINLSNAYILNDLGESVSFVEPFSPDIYNLKDGKVSVKYKIDYSGFFPSKEILSKIKNLKRPFNKREKEFINSLLFGYPSFFICFLENDKWLLLFTSFKTRTIIYNKVEKKSIEFSNIIWSNKERKPYFYPCCIKDNSLIYYAGYEDIKRELEMNDQLSISRRQNLESLLSEMKNDDNPIIFKCKIK